MNISGPAMDELIRNRRSVFPQFYTGENVDDAIVQQMLHNAAWAPSHKLTQPWRFLVFTGAGIEKFAQLQADVYKTVTTVDGTFRQDKYDSLLSKPSLSSHIIAVAMRRDPNKSVPEVEEIGAVFCAIENMYLTATAYGIGCYLSTGGITYFDEAKTAFDLSPDDRLIGFMHVGMPKQNEYKSKRTPVEEFSQWIRS